MVSGCGGGSRDSTDADAGAASRLFPDAFKGVCSGASVPTTAAFDPDAKTHKAQGKTETMDKHATLSDTALIEFAKPFVQP